MKILITMQEPALNGPVDEHFGRAPHFCIHDTQTKETVFVENTAATENSGAGVKAGQQALALGVEVVITGHLGPKALAVLDKGHVRGYGLKSATAADAIDDFLANRLEPLVEK